MIGRAIDRYQVQEKLGTGSNGLVYRVRHRTKDEVFAMKVLFGDLGADARVVARFQREAQATRHIRHPNIIGVEDYGTTINGLSFLVMELIHGQTLAELITHEAPFSPPRVAHIGRQIAAGLQRAHQVGLVHRDVKPSNIMVSQLDNETAKILDFGLVGLYGDTEDSSLTGSGRFVGTPLYMAPEQARDPRRAGPAADIYSLGVTLYQMLTGELPFDGSTPVDVMIKHSVMPVPRLPECGGLENLIYWMLEKQPEQRPTSAATIDRELQRLLKNMSQAPRLPSHIEEVADTLELEPHWPSFQ